MSTTESRAPQLTPKQLAALRPHVISLTDGKLADGSPAAPKSIDEYRSSTADIRAIFEKHLPAFVADHAPGPVPIVIYAHGGLVDKASGFGIAEQQVAWWKENGVYPIHFVWETGIWTAVHDALARWATGGRRGWIEEAKDGFLEVAARLLGGPGIWGDMKLDAAAASVPGGGGRAFAEQLGRWMQANPNRTTVHAVGHSAGSIFHSHLIPVAVDAGVARFDTVTFLAPAVRVDTFAELVMPLARNDRIGRLAVFAMDDQTERDDTCVGLYNKSLLYLVSGSFEPEKGTPILGLERSLTGSKALKAFFTRTTLPHGELVLAPRASEPRAASTARSHGAFDNDIATMDSVARRVTGRGDIRSFATVAGARDISLPAPVVDDPSVGGARGVATGMRRALTIGIDQYSRAGDRLRGCVADAKMWQEALEACGFDVTPLLDADATRERILTGILDLISASKSGDVIAIQYSGHGTTVPDLDADEEAGGAETDDEALCPVDFRDTGLLITDDDLAKLWDVIPSGVGVTLFFDCCHSGDASRELDPDPTLPDDALARVVDLSKDDVVAYRLVRGAAVPESRQAAFDAVRSAERPARPSSRAPRAGREFLFSACRSTEVAWEANGHGDFTRLAAPLVAAGIEKGVTNRAFHATVLGAFGDKRRQTPEWHGSEVLAGRALLSPAGGAKDAAGPSEDAGDALGAAAGPPAISGIVPPAVSTGPSGSADRRIAAVAAILRATAELLES
jgi:hypothetical protein